MEFDHASLIVKGEQYLRGIKKCGVVLSGMMLWKVRESPDLIGWRDGFGSSILIECKRTSSDFSMDRDKRCRSQNFNPVPIGDFRYFLVPNGLIKPERVPPKWGLLYAMPNSIRVVVEAERWELNEAEQTIRVREEARLIMAEVAKLQKTMRVIAKFHQSLDDTVPLISCPEMVL